MTTLHPDILKIDCDAEVKRCAARMKEIVARDLRKRGLIIAMSGGIISANGKYDYLEIAKNLGADETLKKPFSHEEIFNAIGRVLEKHKDRRTE